jgi:hypothetical protein
MSEKPFSEITATQTWVHVLAAAYELEPEQVVQDALLAANWDASSQELQAIMRDRHAWDASIPPYYVAALFAELRPRRA